MAVGYLPATMERFTGIFPTRESRDWCKVAIILLWYTCITRAADCHYDISTEVFPSVINYTGMECTWNITAPSPQRVFLTIEVFELVGGNFGSTGDEATYQVSDEVGSVGPFPLGHNTSVFYSDFSLLLLSANTSANLPNVNFHLTATFRKVVVAYSCDFEVASDCTAAVNGSSQWIYGHAEQGLNIVCQSHQGATLYDTGLFFNPPDQNGTTRLLTQLFGMGRYIVEVDVLWACADPSNSTIILRVTFCGTRNRMIEVQQSSQWSLSSFTIICQEDFEVTFEAEQYTGSSTVIALDNIRISKVLEPVAEPTVVAVTTNIKTEEVAEPAVVAVTTNSKTEESEDDPTIPTVTTSRPTEGSRQGNDRRLLLAGGGALAGVLFLFLIVLTVGCLLCRWRFRRHQSDTTKTGPVGIDNLTYETRLDREYPAPFDEKNTSSFDDVSPSENNDPQYQVVDVKTLTPAPELELRSDEPLDDDPESGDDDSLFDTTLPYMDHVPQLTDTNQRYGDHGAGGRSAPVVKKPFPDPRLGAITLDPECFDDDGAGDATSPYMSHIPQPTDTNQRCGDHDERGMGTPIANKPALVPDLGLRSTETLNDESESVDDDSGVNDMSPYMSHTPQPTDTNQRYGDHDGRDMGTPIVKKSASVPELGIRSAMTLDDDDSDDDTTSPYMSHILQPTGTTQCNEYYEEGYMGDPIVKNSDPVPELELRGVVTPDDDRKYVADDSGADTTSPYMSHIPQPIDSSHC